MNSESDLRTIACLVTLDTKSAEADWFRQEVEATGARAILIDVGVVGSAGTTADITRQEVAAAGGRSLEELLTSPTREEAAPVMACGATSLLQEHIKDGTVHAVVGIGGTQGTSLACSVMQQLPYGFPKIMVSTAASGDTSAFVGIKDITMMFAVSDLLGLNPVTRMVLGNAAAAACGMAARSTTLDMDKSRPVVGMTNLGVLTEGATIAQRLFEEAGFEVIVFHAVGSGGRAMEQMMREGLISAVFDYAMGEIADDVFGGLRAGGPERLRVAGELGLPQVIVPGGAEHLGLFVDPPNHVPDAWKDHDYVFHSPVIFVPRLNGSESEKVAASMGERLSGCRGPLAVFLPEGGTSRYSATGNELEDPDADQAFFAALEENLPDSAQIVRRPENAEHEDFVRAAVEELINMIRKQNSAP